MTRPTIITCAVTGNITTREHHPRLPVTPKEIAEAAIGAARAGAAVVHIHVRDPETGRGTMKLEYYREVVERIRDSGVDVLINLTTGEGGRFRPSDDDPKVAAPDSTLTHPEKRVAHVVELKPDLCSLDLNTMFSGTAVVINTPKNVTVMAKAIYEAGVKPELEVFDTGDIHLGKALIDQGVLHAPTLFQIVLGVKYGANPSPQTLAYLVSILPENSQWAAFGMGRMEYPMLAQAWLLGGHVRVGMEDNVYIKKGVLTEDNAELVRKAIHIIDELGGVVATTPQAREMLGLSPS
jgi:uncharacterized protein (DUF849 family)